MTDDDDDQKWTAKKKSRLHFVATPKSTNAKLYKTRVDGGENFSSNARIKERFLFLIRTPCTLCSFGFPQKNTPKTHSVFPRFGGKGGEGGRETTRENETTGFLGVIKPRGERERCDDGPRVGAKSDVVRARVDESAKDDDAFENREAKSRNELDEKDYTTAWKEEDSSSNDAIRPRGLGRVRNNRGHLTKR